MDKPLNNLNNQAESPNQSDRGNSIPKSEYATQPVAKEANAQVLANQTQDHLSSDQVPKKKKIFFWALIVLFGLLNTILVPIISARFGTLTMILQSGIWVSAIYAFPEILGEFVLSSLLFTIIIFKFFKNYKNFIRIFSLILLFITIFYLARVISGPFIYKLYIKEKYTTATQTQNLDFNKRVKLIDTNSSRMDVKILGNNVIWLESTKANEFPQFIGDNTTELFLFSFSDSTGKTTQISDASKGQSNVIEDMHLSDNGIYWVEGINLYFKSTKIDGAKKELVKKDVAAIVDGSNDKLLIQHALEDDEYGPRRTGLYLFDRESQEEKDLTFLPLPGISTSAAPNVKISGNFICHEIDRYENSKIGLYDINKDKAEILSLPDPDNNLLDCSGDYVEYYFYTFGDNRDPIPIFKIYSISQKKVVYENSFEKANKVKIINNKLYYSPKTEVLEEDIKSNNVISIYDIATGESSEKKLDFSNKELEYWDIDGKYIAYITGELEPGNYDTEIWMESID